MMTGVVSVGSVESDWGGKVTEVEGLFFLER